MSYEKPGNFLTECGICNPPSVAPLRTPKTLLPTVDLIRPISNIQRKGLLYPTLTELISKSFPSIFLFGAKVLSKFKIFNVLLASKRPVA